VGVILGRKGSDKDRIEKELGVILHVDSSSGDIKITLNSDAEDPSKIFKTRDILTAVGRGFSPDKALKLLNDEYNIGIIDLRDYFGKSKSDIQRVKGRVIGKSGKTRRLLEELTGTDISIYGHTISIIGESTSFNIAKDAIEMLIKGNQHKTVYQFLHRKRRDIKIEEMELWKNQQINVN
jgi:ribosomal RNA assembly protein